MVGDTHASKRAEEGEERERLCVLCDWQRREHRVVGRRVENRAREAEQDEPSCCARDRRVGLQRREHAHARDVQRPTEPQLGTVPLANRDRRADDEEEEPTGKHQAEEKDPRAGGRGTPAGLVVYRYEVWIWSKHTRRLK